MESNQIETDLAGSAPRSLKPNRRRLLVVDDEPLLGQTLAIAYRGRHDVVVVDGGRAALELLERDSEFELILCDLMLPDVSGVAVYERLRDERPDLLDRLYLTTGGAFTAPAHEFVEAHADRCLEKPFTIEQVDALLEGAPPRR
jgi:CheY-like chemotaxis protein